MINEKVTSGKAAYEFLWNSWSYENSPERRIAQRKKFDHPDWFYHSASICYFPVDFPDAWKSTRRCPKALRHVDMYYEDELNQDNSEESMFRYLVLGYRFDRSGESEEQLEYSVGSRIEALEALRNVRQTGHGDIYIDVRGRNNWSQ